MCFDVVFIVFPSSLLALCFVISNDSAGLLFWGSENTLLLLLPCLEAEGSHCFTGFLSSVQPIESQENFIILLYPVRLQRWFWCFFTRKCSWYSSGSKRYENSVLLALFIAFFKTTCLHALSATETLRFWVFKIFF